ncbi:DegT/DnrJ/EryC1/StrS family aminotransferase [soil metagenome]
MKINFGDLSREYNEISELVNKAVNNVLSSGWFILGNELSEFEKKFAEYICSKYCVGCANGTDAITLSLMALGIQTGDEVITQVNTCIPTICGIVNSGAVPVFCDIIDDTLMMDPIDAAAQITGKTKAILPVNLFGSSADYERLTEISNKYKIPLIEDCAQSVGAKFEGRRTGTFGSMGAFSFYPSKNLGAYGDAGAVVTDNVDYYNRLLMLRNYGQEVRYYHTVFGINSRLDEIQAAILCEKLNYLDKWTARRQELAEMYNKGFADNPCITIVKVPENVENVYHLYVIKIKNREELQQYLTSKDIHTLIHYPIPCHLQKAYEYLGFKEGDFKIAERNANEILSLPMYPQLKDSEVEYVIKSINDFYAG